MGGKKKIPDVRETLLASIGRPDLLEYCSKVCRVPYEQVSEVFADLLDSGLIERQGDEYRIRDVELLAEIYDSDGTLEEDVVWTRDIGPTLAFLPKNVFDLWNYCFTEIFNNAIDHSESSFIAVRVTTNTAESEIDIYDDGVGIFKKIQRALHLANEREAVLELAKGKFTTDRGRHSGLGIFFSSRMADRFGIASGAVSLEYVTGQVEEWSIDSQSEDKGTSIFLNLSNTSDRRTTDVFDQFSDGHLLDFSRTIVPIRLAVYNAEQLVSRSQAKRVLARVDQFSQVTFDFSDVQEIGQGFADEIFRVFARAHPALVMKEVHTNRFVAQMIAAVRHQARREANAERKSTTRGARAGTAADGRQAAK